MADTSLYLKLPNVIKYFGAIIFTLLTIGAILWALQSLNPDWHPRVAGKAALINYLIYPLSPIFRFIAIIGIFSPLPYCAGFYYYITIRNLPQIILNETGVSALRILGTTNITWEEVKNISYVHKVYSKGLSSSTFTIERKIGKGLLAELKSSIAIDCNLYDTTEVRILSELKKHRPDLVTAIYLREIPTSTTRSKEPPPLSQETAIVVDPKSWTG